MWARRRSSALWTAVYLSLLALVGFVAAQTTDAVCGDKFAWLNNARGQSPCQVAAVLEKQCLPAADVNIPAVPPGKTYLPPTGQLANVCQCNSVLYSLISACSLCQAGALSSMSSWIAACPDSVVVGQYPLPIPADAEIPNWAYMIQLKDGFFDLKGAQAIAYSTPAPSNTPAWLLPVIVTVVLTTLLIAGLAIILIVRRKKNPKPVDVTAFRQRPSATFAPFRTLRRMVNRKDSDYDELVAPQGPPRPLGFLNTARRVHPRRADTGFDLVATPIERQPPMEDVGLRRPSERSNFLSLRRPSSPNTLPVESDGPPLTTPPQASASASTSTSALSHGQRQTGHGASVLPALPQQSRLGHGPTASTTSLAQLGVPGASSSSFLPAPLTSLFSKSPKPVISEPPHKGFDMADDGVGSDFEIIAREFGSYSTGDDAATVVDIGSGDEGTRRGRKKKQRSSLRAHRATTPVDMDAPLPSSRIMSLVYTPRSSSSHPTPPNSTESSAVPAHPLDRPPRSKPPVPDTPALPRDNTPATSSSHDSIIPGLPLPRTSLDTIGLSPATLAAPHPPHWERSRSDMVNDGVAQGLTFDPRGIKLWRDERERGRPPAQPPQLQLQPVQEDRGQSRQPRYASTDDGTPGRPSLDLDPTFPGIGGGGLWLGSPPDGSTQYLRRASPAPSSGHTSSHSSPAAYGNEPEFSRTSPTSPPQPKTTPSSPPSLMSPPSSSAFQLTSPSSRTAASRLAVPTSPPSSSRNTSVRGPRSQPQPGHSRGASGSSSISHSHSRSGSESVGYHSARTTGMGPGVVSSMGHSRTASAAQAQSRGMAVGSASQLYPLPLQGRVLNGSTTSLLGGES